MAVPEQKGLTDGSQQPAPQEWVDEQRQGCEQLAVHSLIAALHSAPVRVACSKILFATRCVL